MNKLILIAAVSLLAGFAAARWLPLDEPPAAADAPMPSFDETLPLDERLAALERAVSEERQARQLLQEEVIYLNGELERVLDGGTGETNAPAADEEEREAQIAERRARFAQRNSPEGRIARLVAAGFAEDRAAWIVSRESQLQMEVLEARYDARRGGDAQAFREAVRSQLESLRADLGEADYERYLEATGRPTSVAVSNVLESSPAQRAGLRPGDAIVRYGGERIFSMSDLNRATYEGQAGETVIVEVVRDGTTIQVPLPRGPIGIMGGSRFRR